MAETFAEKIIGLGILTQGANRLKTWVFAAAFAGLRLAAGLNEIAGQSGLVKLRNTLPN